MKSIRIEVKQDCTTLLIFEAKFATFEELKKKIRQFYKYFKSFCK